MSRLPVTAPRPPVPPGPRFHSAAIACFGAALSSLALAAPPPGHPSPGDAIQMMQEHAPAAGRQAFSGVVLDSIDANEFTYIETDVGGRIFWIATARRPVSRGELIRFEEGVTMENFHSRLLDRTFPSVMFVRTLAAPVGK